MADVKWIKIYTNMISNKKVKRIRKFPEGNNIILIWVFLLALAGESNSNGALFLTDIIPYKPDDLAIELDFDISIITLALITLERFSMIEVFDDVIFIKNWDEYQNIDGLSAIREQNRLRQQRFKGKQRLLQESNVIVTLPVTLGNATDIDIDIDNNIGDFFEKVWHLYPKKKGKGQVSKTQKAKLFKVGYDHLVRCIERYTKENEDERYQQYGSTFFNSGYIDYLDENYIESKPTSKYQDLTGRY